MSGLDDFVPAILENDVVEGKMKLVSVDGVPVLFIKQNGKLYVIDNRCPHMGCGFFGGTLDGSLVVCPCHNWSFDLRTGEYQDDPSMKLTQYEWKVESGKIWVKIDS
jgi:3-phenylpropionate/trans-cinnamate dioxygenase ferredoxin subunit